MTISTDKEAKAANKTVAVSGVKGLTLRVTGNNHKTYVLRICVGGKHAQLPVCDFDRGLAFARKEAMRIRFMVDEDPKNLIKYQREKKNKKESAKHSLYTVEELVRDYIDSEDKRGRWSNSYRQHHAVKFHALVTNHFSEKLKTLPAELLTPEIVAEAFREKWTTMTNTPEKCIGELKRAWSWGVAMHKIPNLSNPCDHGVLKHFLAAPSKRPKATHFPYLPPEQIPEFINEVRNRTGGCPACLIFTILTASRISNILRLKWKQVDFKKALITIPRDQMKVKGLDFDRVTPLSKQAIEILKAMPRGDKEDTIFFSWQTMSRQPLSETSLCNTIRRINADRTKERKKPFHDPKEVDNKGMPRNPTPHGLSRASFETWANSAQRYSHKLFDKDIVEACLDHFNPKYGGAYMREYPIEDMREVLQAWADYCYSNQPTQA